MNVCYVCRQDNGRALYPDPCCAAPDCEHLNDVVHYLCASRSVQAEIRELEYGQGDKEYTLIIEEN